MKQGLIGKVLQAQFRVDAFVASGGMGAVYRVWDIKRNVHLAMKVLHEDLAEDPSIFKRFRREARALKKLSHPNIVPFYGLFEAHRLAFLLERYVDGPSLKQILRDYKGRPVPVEEALIYLKALSSALGYAHVHDVIHCDVKPGNVMVDRGGSIFLTDFGIARHAESTTTTLGFAGTATYMAPEQCRGEAVTEGTDVYALGVMLFEMLTGRRPFRGDERETEGHGSTAAERVRYAHIHLHPPNPKVINPKLGEGLSSVILRAVEKEPKNRFSSVRDFYDEVCQAQSVKMELAPDRIVPPKKLHPKPILQKESVSATSVQAVDVFESTFDRVIPHLSRYKNVLLAGALSVVSILVIVLIVRGGLPDSSQPTLREQVLSDLTPAIGFGVTEGIQFNEVSEGSKATSTQALTRMPEDSPIAVNTAISTDTPIPKPTSSPTPLPIIEPMATSFNPKDGVELVFVPEGPFWMGSNPEDDPYFWGAESPMHQIRLDAFWIYRTEVTNAMYQVCVQERQCPRPQQTYSSTHPEYYGNPRYDDYPVIYVTWGSARAYCSWAGARLPSEAEWEKAARGDDQRLFPWGNVSPMGLYLNYCDSNCSSQGYDTSRDDGYPGTAPVGNYPAGASPYGVYDMAGNVWEWVFDWFRSNYYELTLDENPMGPVSGESHVIRGGSWSNPVESLRTTVRFYFEPDNSLDNLGFRCVMDDS